MLKLLHNPSSHAAMDFSLELANDKHNFLKSPSHIKINCVIYAPTAIFSYSYYLILLYFILPFTEVSCLCP